MKAYPSYKDSGTIWQGEVPSHWEKLRNKNELYPKVNHVGFNPNKLPMLSLTKKGVIVRDLETGKGKFSADESKFLIVEPGDFVFCHYDIQETPRTVGLSAHLGYITGSYNIYGYKGKNRRFFYYLHEYFDNGKLLCPLYKGLRNTIRQDRFLSMRIFLPPVEEQHAIVAYLDKKCAEIDELISRRQSIIERLRELKQSIIAEAVTKGLNPDVPLKESSSEWIGLVPGHWELDLLKRFCSPVKNKNSSLASDTALQFRYGEIIEKSNIDKTDAEYLKTISEYTTIQPNNIVINGLNLNYDFVSQRVAISTLEGVITSAYISLDINQKISPKYLSYQLKSFDTQKLFHGLGKGIRLTLTYKILSRVLIAVPPSDEQEKIVDYLDKKCAEIDELVSRQEQIIEKLKELKTSTIAHVVTGKVDVRDAV